MECEEGDSRSLFEMLLSASPRRCYQDLRFDSIEEDDADRAIVTGLRNGESRTQTKELHEKR